MTGRPGLIRLTQSSSGEGSGECGSDDCPNVYATGQGSFVVQGSTFTGFRAPDGESLVEIPEETLREAFRVLGW